MQAENSNTPGDVPFRPAGSGHHITRNCMGCSKHRSVTGGLGSGVWWRCADCMRERVRRNQEAGQ